MLIFDHTHLISMKYSLVGILLLIATATSAQKFITNTTGRKLIFKEMQRQYNDWSKTIDLKAEKHWKYFKRWEMDMQMHTNAQGEPGDVSAYIDAVVNAAREKELAASS